MRHLERELGLCAPVIDEQVGRNTRRAWVDAIACKLAGTGTRHSFGTLDFETRRANLPPGGRPAEPRVDG